MRRSLILFLGVLAATLLAMTLLQRGRQASGLEALTPRVERKAAVEQQGATILVPAERTVLVGESQPEVDQPAMPLAAKPLDWHADESGSPFALLERGSVDSLLPTKRNFVRILKASDGLSTEEASLLWERGDAREAFEVCMQIAAASAFARGYVDREVNRFLAGEPSKALAKEFEPAGSYLRRHLRDRAGFERALNRAHELGQRLLWTRPERNDIDVELGDWCGELYEVFEDTSTQVYELGIEPYLPR